jgi:poly(A) polymerase
MLRAVRFAVKLGFRLHPDCEVAMHKVAELLSSIPSARLYDETIKLLLSGYALQTFEMLRHYGLFQILFPATESSLSVEDNGFPRLLLIKALDNSDNRIAEGKTVTAYFLFAAFLWEPVKVRAQEMMARGMVEYMAYQEAANEIISTQIKSTALPRHITMAMREVWSLQPKFNIRVGSKPSRLLAHPRFRAGYDFLLLRAETGGADLEVAQWWEKYQVADENEQRKMTRPPRKEPGSKVGRTRSYRGKSKDSVTEKEV